MTKRTEAADLIAAAIETADYSCSAWAPEGNNGPVRVYVTIPAANWKKKAVKIGYVAVNLDGTLESHLEKQSGSIMSLIPTLAITPATPKQSTAPVHADERFAGMSPEEKANWETAERHNQFDPLERG